MHKECERQKVKVSFGVVFKKHYSRIRQFVTSLSEMAKFQLTPVGKADLPLISRTTTFQSLIRLSNDSCVCMQVELNNPYSQVNTNKPLSLVNSHRMSSQLFWLDNERASRSSSGLMSPVSAECSLAAGSAQDSPAYFYHSFSRTFKVYNYRERRSWRFSVILTNMWARPVLTKDQLLLIKPSHISNSYK